MSTDTAANAAAPEQSAEESAETTDESSEQNQQASSDEAAPQTEGELKDALKEAAENGASKKELQSMVKEFSLKVNGKTVSKKIDLSNEAELIKELQMAAAGREAMQGKAEYEKALKQLVEQLKHDPLGVAEELGLDADEIAAMRLRSKIEQAKKSPEQVEREKLEQQIAEFKKKEAEREQALANAQQKQALEEAQRTIDDEIDKALDGYKSLPKASPMVYDLISKNMLWVMDNFEQFGYGSPDEVRVEDVLPTVEQQLKSSINKILEDVPEEFLDAYLGNKIIDKQRQKRVSNVKKVNNINNINKAANAKVEKKEERPKIKLSDWMRDV